MRILRDHNPEVNPDARFDSGQLYIVVKLVRVHTLGECPERWTSPLPSAKTLMLERWPSIADVFCAESASVHIALRLPVINKKSGEELLRWAGMQEAMDVDAEDDGIDSQLPNLRDMRRQQRIRTAASGSTPLSMPPRKRRRGVRKWAISVDATTGGVPASDTVTAADVSDVIDGSVGEGERRQNMRSPSILCGLVDWFVRSLRHVTASDRDALGAQAVAVADAPWTEWATATSVDELVQQAMARPEEYPLLHSLILQTVYIIREYAAQTTRNDELQKYYNAVIWHLKPRSVSCAYLQHLLAPQLLSTPISGIPRVHRMALHHDGEHDEFYISTDGSVRSTVDQYLTV